MTAKNPQPKPPPFRPPAWHNTKDVDPREDNRSALEVLRAIDKKLNFISVTVIIVSVLILSALMSIAAAVADRPAWPLTG